MERVRFESSIGNNRILIVTERYMLVLSDTEPFSIYHPVQGDLRTGPLLVRYVLPVLGGILQYGEPCKSHYLLDV